MCSAAIANLHKPSPDELDYFRAIQNPQKSVHCRAEHVQVALPIITSCVLIGGSTFLEQHGPTLSRMLEGLIGNVKERAMLVLISAVELLIRAQPEVACRVLQLSLARLLACLLYGQETGLVIASEGNIFPCRPPIQQNATSLLLLPTLISCFETGCLRFVSLFRERGTLP